MGIKKKSLLTAAVVVGFLSAGGASAVELAQVQIHGPIADTTADQGGTQLRGDLRPLLLADAEDSGSDEIGGVLGLPVQNQRRLFTLERGDILLRMRFIDIIPKGGSGEVFISPYLPVAGSKLSVSGATGFEGDVSYMVTPMLGVEVSLESSTHALKDNSGQVASTTGNGSDLLGTTSMLPLTVIAQYHFMPKMRVHPYVGLGLNYTLFNKEESGLNGVTLNVDNTVGLAAQTGVDIGIHERWFLNVDLKYIDMSSTMNLSNPNSGVTDKTDLKISPWIFGVGIGTYF